MKKINWNFQLFSPLWLILTLLLLQLTYKILDKIFIEELNKESNAEDKSSKVPLFNLYRKAKRVALQSLFRVQWGCQALDYFGSQIKLASSSNIWRPCKMRKTQKCQTKTTRSETDVNERSCLEANAFCWEKADGMH